MGHTVRTVTTLPGRYTGVSGLVVRGLWWLGWAPHWRMKALAPPLPLHLTSHQVTEKLRLPGTSTALLRMGLSLASENRMNIPTRPRNASLGLCALNCLVKEIKGSRRLTLGIFFFQLSASHPSPKTCTISGRVRPTLPLQVGSQVFTI